MIGEGQGGRERNGEKESEADCTEHGARYRIDPRTVRA